MFIVRFRKIQLFRNRLVALYRIQHGGCKPKIVFFTRLSALDSLFRYRLGLSENSTLLLDGELWPPRECPPSRRPSDKSPRALHHLIYFKMCKYYTVNAIASAYGFRVILVRSEKFTKIIHA